MSEKQAAKLDDHFREAQSRASELIDSVNELAESIEAAWEAYEEKCEDGGVEPADFVKPESFDEDGSIERTLHEAHGAMLDLAQAFGESLPGSSTQSYGSQLRLFPEERVCSGGPEGNALVTCVI